MSKLDEILLEIDGKIGYADATGNCKAKEELLEIQKCLKELKEQKNEKENT